MGLLTQIAILFQEIVDPLILRLGIDIGNI